MTPSEKKIAPTAGEAFFVITICFGLFILISLDAVLGGFSGTGSFSDTSMINLMSIEMVFGVIGLGFLHLRGYALKNLLPSPTWRGSASGAALCAVALAGCWLVLLFIPQAQVDVQQAGDVLSKASKSVGVIIALSILNGIYEETILLGYLVDGFSSAGASFALGLSILVRLSYHLYQGPVGGVSVVVFGLIVSAYYWRTRQLWPAAFAHILADVVGLSQI